MLKKLGKMTGILLLVLFGMIAALSIGGQIILNTSKMKNLLLETASNYVEGDINLSKLEISMFRNFPNVQINLDDFSLTYPHDRFSNFDKEGAQHSLRNAGRGETSDTLASFSRFSISLNYMKALTGTFSIPSASLDSARIYLHQYDSLHSNLEILDLQGEQEEEEESPLPHIIVKDIALTGQPHIVYTSAQDSVFGSFSLAETRFEGKFSTRTKDEPQLNFLLDSMLVYAQIARNKTNFGIHHLDLNQEKDNYHLDAEGAAMFALNNMGEIDIPISLKTSFFFPDRSLDAFSFRELKLKLAPLEIQGEGDLEFYSDSTYIRSELEIEDCKADELIRWLGKSIFPDLLKIKTDASINLTALCDGFYFPADKKMPALLLEMVLPEANVAYAGMDKKGKIQTILNAETDDYGNLNLSVDELVADLAGIYLEGNASMEDALSPDPLCTLNAKLKTSLDTLMYFLPDSTGLEASGQIEGKVDGMMFLSDMDFYNFAGADIAGEIRSDQVHVEYQPMNLKAYLENARISLKPTDSKLDPRYTLGEKIQAVYAEIDSLYTRYGDHQDIVRGKNLSVIAQNAATAESEEFGKEYHPIIAQVTAQALVKVSDENTFIGLVDSKNNLKFSHHKNEKEVNPILTADSQNGKIMLRQGQGRVGISNAGLKVTAIREKSQRDSTQKDFNALVAQYLRDWKIYGSMTLENGFLTTPYFPLLNHIHHIEGNFNNDDINLKSFNIRTGNSDLDIRGKVSGIRQSILNNGILDMQLDINSDKINMNEILTAYDSGTKFIESKGKDLALDENLSDEEYIQQITSKAPVAEEDSIGFLLMLPDRVDAKINLNANEIVYSDLKTDWVSSEIALKDACLQFTNTLATSNMGDIYFEGYYASKSKDNLKAGFDLNLASITADKVITLFPAVDSIMPMLKSFKGILDCELAAVGDLDTLMNLKTNSINGVMKIKGKDLSLDNVGPLKKLARTLMFKNKKTGYIDDMSVEGLILNDELQVFPFVMKIDRYLFAASGIQQFNQNFKYHVSVLKSPLPFRFGIDLKGNFDDWNFKIGKAKYKNANVPVFTKELNAIQFNLVNSIHDIFNRGVDQAVRQTEKVSQEMEEKRKEQGIDLESDAEELSMEEQIEMEGAIIENEVEEEINEVLKTE